MDVVARARDHAAVVYFFGHGGSRQDLVPRLICYDGNTFTVVVHREAARDELVRQLGVPPEHIVVLDALPDGALGDVLLAVFQGCYTAFEGFVARYGTPADAFVRKGARAALGWRGPIYDPQAHTWAELFWQFACQGHPTKGRVTVREACRLAVEELTVLYEKMMMDSGGLHDVRWVGNPDFRLYPAGYRDDR